MRISTSRKSEYSFKRPLIEGYSSDISANKLPVEGATFTVALLSFYILFSAISLFFYRYQINPDGISYIRVAQKYFSGDFSSAVNGYWSPLISWLLIPFGGMKNPLHIHAIAKIVLLLVGLSTLFVANLLARRFEISRWSRRIFLISLVPMTIFFALSEITPDLLVVCIVLLYFYVVLDDEYADKPFGGVTAGLLGGLGYLAKSFVLPFFLLHFHCMIALHYFRSAREARPKIIRQWIFGILVFSIVSGPWVALISSKYHTLTVGNAGAYNYSLNAPGNDGYPAHKGIIPPPDLESISVWEDPSYIRAQGWYSPQHQLQLTLRNIKKIHSYLDSFNLNLLIAGGFLLMAARLKDSKKRFYSLSALLSILIYCSGYALIHVDRRYLWPVLVLLFLMGFFLIEQVTFLDSETHGKRGAYLKYALAFVLAASFVLRPIKELAASITENPDKEIYLLSRDLSEHGINGNIAANGHWNKTLYLAYYLNTKFYGIVPNSDNAEKRDEQLRKYNIRYYFVWPDRPNSAGDSFRIIFQKPVSAELSALTVYDTENLLSH